MVKIIWTEQALKDLDEIAEYISKDSVKYAELMVKKLFSATEILVKFPEFGRAVPEFKDKKIREIIYGNYRIVYLVVNSSRLDILTIHHSSRMLRPRVQKKKTP